MYQIFVRKEKPDLEKDDSLGLELIDFEVSNLKTSKRRRLKCETIKISFVSLLLGMATAVGMIKINLPIGITIISIGTILKNLIIAISFQVVGIYWGMIIGLLDGILQLIFFGTSPLFSISSGIAEAIMVFNFWIWYKVIFQYYKQDSAIKKVIAHLICCVIILATQPLVSVFIHIPAFILIFGNAWFSQFWIGFGMMYAGFIPYYFFTILLFTLTTDTIQLIAKRFLRN